MIVHKVKLLEIKLPNGENSCQLRRSSDAFFPKFLACRGQKQNGDELEDRNRTKK
jgi:hypothetical protein